MEGDRGEDSHPDIKLGNRVYKLVEDQISLPDIRINLKESYVSLEVGEIFSKQTSLFSLLS